MTKPKADFLIDPQVGDIVTFKCGGRATLTRIEVSEVHPDAWFFAFEGNMLFGLHYAKDGVLFSAVEKKRADGIFSIISIEKGDA